MNEKRTTPQNLRFCGDPGMVEFCSQDKNLPKYVVHR